MTAVIGILNKRGVAIAADSAVTRTKSGEEKVTKNGNKMLRLSNAVPVSIMITGNADFNRNPWEIIVRQYRRNRGDIKHSTVEECVKNFLKYVGDNTLFWDEKLMHHRIQRIIEFIFKTIDNKITEKHDDCEGNHNVPTSQEYISEFILEAQSNKKHYVICNEFSDYDTKKFLRRYRREFEDFFKKHHYCYKGRLKLCEQIQKEIQNSFAETVLNNLKFMFDSDDITQLIFCGFGERQEYPSLVSVKIKGGIDNKVLYYIDEENDIINISDRCPSAIRPFAQSDVSEGILNSIYNIYESCITTELSNQITGDIAPSVADIINQLTTDSDNSSHNHQYFPIPNIDKKLNAAKNKHWRAWEKKLQNYDLKAMAALAESLIDLTGFHRILTFEQEGVGGPVDVAVITKNHGFTWLSRKSWYHHKDVNGQYGSLGI